MSNDTDTEDNDGFEPFDLDGVTVEGINAEWKSAGDDPEVELDTFVTLSISGSLTHFRFSQLSDERVITKIRREATSKGWRLGDVVSPLKRTIKLGKLAEVEAMFYAYGGPA